MVFFTCNACGESLKKAQVDKHANMCRGCQVLSCIDCGKDFWGDDYKHHNRCISEDQKYGGKGYEAKANKGDVKQQLWIQRVNEAMNKPGVSAMLKDVLRQVSSYDNVPRKRAKFQNWMTNSLKIKNTSLQDEVWLIINTADKAPESTQKENNNTVGKVPVCTNGGEKQDGDPNTDEKKTKLNKRERKEARKQKNGKATKGDNKTGTQEVEEAPTCQKKKGKKRKRDHEGNEEQNGHDAENETSLKKSKLVEAANDADDDLKSAENQAASQGKFNWKGNIKAILKESPDQELPLKKLRKKLLAAYYSFTGDSNFKTEEEVLALFNKKINKNPMLRVLKDRVKLVK